VKAILLLGGLGTRLRPFTLHRPKPLLPVLNRPILFYQLAQVKAAGVREVILALGHKAAHFRRSMGDGRKWGMRFRYSIENEPLGTGGAIGLAGRFADGPALVLNGDILSDIDLAAFAAFHRKKRAEATLALTPVEDPSAFGVIETDRTGRVLSFTEKPPPGQAPANTINAGFYLFEPSVFRAIPAGRPVSVERETFPALLAAQRPLYGFRHDGFWADVGTLPSYLAVHAGLLRRYDAWRTRFRLGGRRLRPGVWADRGVVVAPSARLKGRVLLGEGCRVGGDVRLEGTVCVGPRVVIAPGAYIKDSILHAGARVGANARLDGAVVGEKARLPAGAVLPPGAAAAPGVPWDPAATLETPPKNR
jgi:NDP-sugar pyrophosphorylase family protein